VSKAEQADKYQLYEQAAQDPAMMIRFLRALHGGDPRLLGEDFCGTAAVSRAWAGQGASYAAVAVDHDEEPLRRAAAERVTLRRADVMAADDPVDLIAALNFSICECLDRRALLAYLKHTRRRLEARRGILVVDLFGGASALVNTAMQVSLTEDVTYTWENEAVNVMTNQIGCRMSFQFDDGSEMPAAFLYQWRLWTPCEMMEAMREAGYARLEVYDRLGEAIDSEGNLYVRPVSSLYATVEDLSLGPDEEGESEFGGSPWAGPGWRSDAEEEEASASGVAGQLPDWQCFVVARTTEL
jgi:hypothetical protein